MKTLTEVDVDAIHDEILKISGGLYGKCPDSPLESVLYRVFNHILYNKKTSKHEVGALYAYTIATGHPYNDGNKRTALTTMLVFFEINNIKFIASDHELAQKMISIAENKTSLKDFSRYIKNHVT